MKLTCQNMTPELYPDNCATECPVPDDCTLNTMAQGGVVFNWLPGGKSVIAQRAKMKNPSVEKRTPPKRGRAEYRTE
jgi:hypothetical protein